MPTVEMKKQKISEVESQSWSSEELGLEHIFDKVQSGQVSIASWGSHSEIHSTVLQKGRVCENLKDDQDFRKWRQGSQWNKRKHRQQETTSGYNV